MSITIAEALKLRSLKNFSLVAGEWGLDNKVDKVGILEYENSKEVIDEQFGKGDFVITSFFYARNDEKILIESIMNLINAGVSGLAIKNIYYESLPEEVINIATEKSFPIFLFDRHSYFEDIITDIMDAVRNKDKYEILETKVDILIKNSISKAMVRELALDINGSFKKNFIVAYCLEKRYIGNENIIKIIEGSSRRVKLDVEHSIFKYRSGILFIYSYDDMDHTKEMKKFKTLINDIDITSEEFNIGISNIHTNINEMNKGINEGIYAVRANEVMNKEVISYRDIGIYKIILPYIDDMWIKEFYDEIIMPLKDYDAKYNTQIMTTAIKYVENEGSVKETAKDLFQHNNTIRYRVGKMKEILGMENLDGSFYEQLSVAIKIYKKLNP